MRAAKDRLVDVRPGEARPAVRSFLLLALLIAGHTMLETARDALFLGKLPASRLAPVYALIAGLALVVSGPNARFVRRFGEGRALLVTLLLAAYGTTALYLQRQTPAVAFAIYVWSAFLGTVLVVQFWMFLARVLTPSQGKRLFGPIAAGGVTGAIAGAAGATLLLDVLPVRDLLMGSAIAFVLCALLSTAIEPAAEAPEHEHERERDPLPVDHRPSTPPGPRSGGRGLAVIAKHPYLARVAALTALSTAAVLGVDYMFKSEAARHVAAADLGRYFARSYAAFNAAALVVQVIVAGPLVQRAGVARALLVMPVLLAGGASAALITGSPAAVVLTKGADGALRHSLHRLTLELLGLPVSAELRARVKPVIEGALPRAVQAAMAAVIFVLAAAGVASLRALAAIVSALSIGWIVAAIGLRRPHLDMFRRSIAKGTLDPGQPLRLDARLVRAVQQELSSDEPTRVIAAMDLLVAEGHAASIHGAVLEHPSDEVRVHALRLMAKLRVHRWIARARALTYEGEPEQVRVAAVRALAAVQAHEAVRACLADESPSVRAHAAIALSAAQHASEASAAPLILEILHAPGERGRAARLALLDAIRDTGQQRFAGVILALLDPSDDDVMERAVRAMESAPDRRFIPILIARIHVRATREAARGALVKLGAPAQDAVERAMRDAATPPAARLHLPRTISRFGNQRAADFLTEQLAVEASGLVRYKALRGLGRLVAATEVRVDRGAILERMRANLVEHLEILARWLPLSQSPETLGGPGGRLVLGLLADKLRQSLDRAFRLLQIAYRREDIRRAYLALGGDDPRARSNALELLDALTVGERGQKARETRDLLKLVVDDLSPLEKLERGAAHVPDAPTDEEAALARLVRARDLSLAALAAFHARERGFTRVVEEAALAARERPSLMAMAGAVLGDEMDEVAIGD